jgi:RND family efflux transporter MFP subunit
MSDLKIKWSIVGSLVLAAGCGHVDPPAPPPPAVTVVEAPAREITEWTQVTGRFEAVDAVEIRPRVSGYIRRVTFAEGKEVRKGEVLFEIDPRPYQAEVNRAQAALDQARSGAELARRDVERAERLVKVQAISKEEYDGRTSAVTQSAATVRGAEAALETARLNLDWTKVRSPISGRVSRAEVTEGNLVQAGPPAATLLTTVVSLDPIYVVFDADEATYLKYGARARTAGQRIAVRLELGDETDFPHRGYIDFLDNQLDPASGTIRARAVFTNHERRFTPGLFARLELAGGAPHRAVLVPDQAVGTDQDKKFVLVVKADSTVEYRPVELGSLMEGYRVVTSGVTAGERVVVKGLQRVRPGIKVVATLKAGGDSTLASVGR